MIKTLALLAALGSPGGSFYEDVNDFPLTISGDIYTNGNEVCAYNETTDAAPDGLILKSGDCYAQGTQTASNLILAGGLDEKKITVTNTAISALDSVTQTTNGTSLAALVDGTAWTACAGETTTVCADRIATAIQAQSGSGVVCDNVAAVVYCQPVSCSTYAWSSASADSAALDGVAWTSSNGTDGQVLVPRGLITIPSISTSGDTDTGLSWPAANTLRFFAGGTAYKLDIAPTIITMGVTLDMLTSKVYNSAGMLDLGGAVTSTHALDATVGSVGISGALEVDGALFVDGSALFSGATYTVADNGLWYFGTGTDAVLVYTTAQTPDALVLGIGADSNGIIVSETADRGYDFAHAQQADPTIWLQSHNQSATQHLSLQHNATDALFATGAGMIRLQPTVKGVVVPTIVDATGAEPIACDATTVGTVAYVDDNNDTATADLCACIATGDAAYDWRSLLVTASACSKF